MTSQATQTHSVRIQLKIHVAFRIPLVLVEPAPLCNQNVCFSEIERNTK